MGTAVLAREGRPTRALAGRREAALTGTVAGIEWCASLALLTWWAGPFLGYWSHGALAARFDRWLPAAVGLLVVSRLRPTLAAVADAAPLVGFVGWAALSRWWSIDPGATSGKVGALRVVVLFGLYLGTRWSRAQLLHLVAGALASGAALSLAAVWRSHYPWRTERVWGAYLHPNFLGHASALGLVLSLVLACRRRPGVRGLALTVAWLVVAGVHGVLLVRSESDGGLLVVPAGLAVALVAAARPVARARGAGALRAWNTVVAGGATAATVGVLFNGPLLRLAGQDPTLTGRRDLWRAVWPYVERRPLAGYGFWAMWQGARGYAGQIERHWAYGVVPHAHNAFLEVAVGTGVVGLGLFVAAVVLAAARAARLIDRHPGVVGVWGVAFLAAVVLTGLVESVTVFPPSAALAVLAALCVRERRADTVADGS